MQSKIPLLLLVFILFNGVIKSQEMIHLWPDNVPGEEKVKAKAVVSDNKKRNVTRLSEVTDPIIKVYPPEEALNKHAGVIICPGGGYHILAIDLEGYEIAQWLSQLGYTAFVLQYRVPQKQKGALMDAQRAIRIVRSKAGQWNINPEKIGVLGFSAGGNLAARAATLYQVQTYPPIDKIYKLSCKPNFSILIYPAYLDKGENQTLTPELKVNKNTPPMFLFATADDKHANSALVMTAALRNAGVPVELHLLASGGHGYGLRPGNKAAETWPLLAKKWLETILSK